MEGSEKMTTWRKYFDYIEANLKTCNADYRVTKEFCDINNLSFDALVSVLQATEGKCDCWAFLRSQCYLERSGDLDKDIVESLE